MHRLTLLGLLLPTALAAQDPRYSIRRWTTDEGLPQSSISAIVEGADGYLWLGTAGGLVRFDGQRFTVFGSGTNNGINSDRVFTMARDSAGVLWVGTERGLVRYDGHTFRTFTQADGLPFDWIISVYPAWDGHLWVGTLAGLVRSEGERFRSVSAGSAAPESTRVSAIYPLGRDSLWVMQYYRPPLLLANTTADTAPTRLVRGKRFSSVYAVEPGGAAWGNVVTSGPLTRVHGDTVETFPPPKGEGPPDRVLLDPSGAWVALAWGHIYRLRREGVGHAHWAPVVTLGEAADVLYADHEGNLWVGTGVHGLVRLHPQAFRTYSVADGLDRPSTTSVLEDRDGSMLVGNNCGGVHRIVNGRVTKLGAAGCSWALVRDSSGAVWIGSYGGGLVRLGGGARKEINGRAGGLPSDVAVAPLAAPDGTLWAGTDLGLAKLEHNRVVRTWRVANGLPDPAVRALALDPDGTLWIGTLNGLARLRHDTMTAWTTKDGLSNNTIRHIRRDHEGTLWLATYGGGIVRFKDGVFRAIREQDGLQDNFLAAALEDDAGNLWMSSNRGVFRVSLSELNAVADGRATAVHPAVFDKSDGMASAEANGGAQPNGYKARDGSLWFTTIDGVTTVRPSQAAEAAVPRVRIESAMVDHLVRTTDSAVVLAPGQRSLEIGYTGISFTAPEHVRFRYQLDGYDDNWVEAGTRRTAYYTALPPGRYTFHVSAAGRNGVWATDAASVAVVAQPWIWQTWWFKISGVLATLGIVAFFVRQRIARLHEARERQEAFARELIESQEAERKRIAGELHDGLGQDLLVVKNRAVLARQHGVLAPRVEAELVQIEEATTAALQNVRALSKGLGPYQLEHLGLTQALEGTIRQAAESAGIELELALEHVDARIPKADQIHVFRVVQEAVTNAIKHGHASKMSVRIVSEPNGIRAVIRDDGKGFPVERDHRGRPVGGFGMTGIAERVRLLGGTFDVRSAPGEGAEVTVTIPSGGAPA